MTFMKKHLFLHVDYHSTVKLLPSEEKKIKKWLGIASPVVQSLIGQKIISGKHIEQIKVSLLICGTAKIRDLNMNFRNKNKVTDVLSFPAYENLRQNVPMDKVLFLGDLAICHHKVRTQSQIFKISYMDEFIHLFFHGLIHLMGYDHEISKLEEKLMEQWEQRALKKFSKIKKGDR